MHNFYQISSRIVFKYIMIIIILIGVFSNNISLAEASPVSILNNDFFSNLHNQRSALNPNSNYLFRESYSLENPIGCNVAELIEAIEFANINPGPDMIALTPECLYQLDSVNNFDIEYQYNGLPVITSSITINGNGAILSSSIDNLRAFQVSQDASLTINNLEINGFKSDDYGGAVLNHGTLTINKVTFITIFALKGGSIFNAGQAEISNSTFAGNRACC